MDATSHGNPWVPDDDDARWTHLDPDRLPPEVVERVRRALRSAPVEPLDEVTREAMIARALRAEGPLRS